MESRSDARFASQGGEAFPVLGEVYTLWTASLGLEPEPFQAVQTWPGFRSAGLIFFAAALSKALADAGIMMINRVTRAQFLLGLLGGTVVLALAAVSWATCIWLACRWLVGLELAYRDLLGLVLVSYAPLVFGFLVIVPHLGLLWDGVLKLWMLLITLAGLHQQYGVPVAQAVVASGLGWLLFHLLGELFGSKVEKVRLRLLGRHRWVRPKEAALALLERELESQ